MEDEKINSPINTAQQLMVIAAEECGELTQVCMKMMRRYDTIQDMFYSSKRQDLVEEAGDVLCMLELMIEFGLFDWDELHRRSDHKKEKLKTWSDLIHTFE